LFCVDGVQLSELSETAQEKFSVLSFIGEKTRRIGVWIFHKFTGFNKAEFRVT
jgi:hypothetical protein